MPPWFTSALDHKPEHTEIDVDGCRIHLRTWGRSEQPPVVFVHGMAARNHRLTDVCESTLSAETVGAIGPSVVA